MFLPLKLKYCLATPKSTNQTIILTNHTVLIPIVFTNPLKLKKWNSNELSVF